jgi:PAS domain S-box-containing protein
VRPFNQRKGKKVRETQERATDHLYQQAEIIVQGRPFDLSRLSLQDTKELIHELQIHQIELELQNETLQATQKGLELSYSRYMDLYNFAPVGYVILNKNSLILEVNLTATIQLGSERAQLLRRPLSQFIAEADQDSYYFWRTALFTTREPQSCEVRIIRADKSQLYAQLTGTLALTADNKENECRVIITDITLIKQAQAALQESEEKWRTLVKNIPSLVTLVDLEGKILFINRPRHQRIEEIIGSSILDHIPVEDHQKVYQILEKVKTSGEVVNYESVTDSPDGKIYLSNRVGPLKRGEEIAELIAISTDISEKRRAEEAVEEGRRFIQRVTNTAPYIVYIYDLVGQCNVYANDQIFKILGYTPDEAQMMGDTFLKKLCHPDDYKQVMAHIQRVGTSLADEVFENEYRMKHANGEWRWLHSRDIVFTRNAEGLAEQILGTAQDITRRKQAEQEKNLLLEAISQQREELRALSIRLAEVQEAERRRMAQELHDKMGQNLTALGFNLKFVQTQLPDVIIKKESIQACLDTSLALVEETTDDIRQVIADLHPPMLDDYGLMETLDWYATRFTARTGISIKVRGKVLSHRPAATVETALFRIVQEALTNVSKHSKATKATITVSAKKQSVRLTISDNGVGFEADPIARRGGRLNLGLIIMRERAEAVGGRCYVESKPGQGTWVIVEVPG